VVIQSDTKYGAATRRPKMGAGTDGISLRIAYQKSLRAGPRWITAMKILRWSQLARSLYSPRVHRPQDTSDSRHWKLGAVRTLCTSWSWNSGALKQISGINDY